MVVESHYILHFDFCILTFAMNVDFNLYLITDRKVTKMPLPEAVRLALKGGVRAVQLREKYLPMRELLALAQELRKITKESSARLFINDRVDVAVAVDADGVHLGGQSIPLAEVRRIVGRNMLIGASTHSIEEAREAEKAGADFITFGPIFSTPSKKKFGAPVGMEALRTVKKNGRIPVFGLGGIKSENIAQVMRAGADGVAMISAILAGDDIQTAAELMNRRIGEAANGNKARTKS
jgi:thiamine-phosphate pyrophosphorylase